MPVSGPSPRRARTVGSPRLLAALLALFVAAGFGTLLLTGQDHHTEARIMCERFVKRRAPQARVSGATVRDLSSTRHVVTGTARVPGQAPRGFVCTVSHAGTTWILDGMTGL